MKLELDDQSMEKLYTREKQTDRSTPIMDFKDLNKAQLRKKAETKPRNGLAHQDPVENLADQR